MTYISRERLRLIKADIDKALAPIAKEYKLGSLKCGRGSFSASNFSLKVEGVVSGALSKEAERYNHYRHNFDLPPLGSQFGYLGITYTITGMNTTGTKVFAAQKHTGKAYQFRVEHVKLIVEGEGLIAA